MRLVRACQRRPDLGPLQFCVTCGRPKAGRALQPGVFACCCILFLALLPCAQHADTCRAWQHAFDEVPLRCQFVCMWGWSVSSVLMPANLIIIRKFGDCLLSAVCCIVGAALRLCFCKCGLFVCMSTGACHAPDFLSFVVHQTFLIRPGSQAERVCCGRCMHCCLLAADMQHCMHRLVHWLLLGGLPPLPLALPPSSHLCQGMHACGRANSCTAGKSRVVR